RRSRRFVASQATRFSPPRAFSSPIAKVPTILSCPSHFQPDGTHEGERVAVPNHSGTHPVIEVHGSIGELIFKMNAFGAPAQAFPEGGQGQVVGGDQSDRTPRKQSADNRFGPDTAIV